MYFSFRTTVSILQKQSNVFHVVIYNFWGFVFAKYYRNSSGCFISLCKWFTKFFTTLERILRELPSLFTGYSMLCTNTDVCHRVAGWLLQKKLISVQSTNATHLQIFKSKTTTKDYNSRSNIGQQKLHELCLCCFDI